jgi:hypothetical protein
MTSFYFVTSYDIKCTEVFFHTALPIFISVLNTAEHVGHVSFEEEAYGPVPEGEDFFWPYP